MSAVEAKPVKPCRSRGPEAQPCTQPRGHKAGWRDIHTGALGKQWTGGVRQPAVPYAPDNGHMSEADYQTWGRL